MQAPYRPIDRRPLASRGWRVFIWLSERLAAGGVSANAISIAGMVCGLAAGACLTATSSEFARLAWFGTTVFVQLRLVANLLDGMVALAAGQASPVGELYNEVPDRVSDAAIFLGAGYAAGSEPMLGCLAATVAIFTAYVRVMGKVAGAPQDYCGPMAKPQRMALVTVLGVVGTLDPDLCRYRFVLRPEWGAAAGMLLVVIVGGLATAVRRLVRSARFLRSAEIP